MEMYLYTICFIVCKTCYVLFYHLGSMLEMKQESADENLALVRSGTMHEMATCMLKNVHGPFSNK